jgi:hypothetical protein
MMCRRGFPEDPPSADVNTVLECLLGSLEAALAEVGSASHGRPLFEVEAALTERLRRRLPGVRFSAEDIRNWSARISS